MTSTVETYAFSLSFDAPFSEAVVSLAENLARVTENQTLLEKHAPVHLTLGMFHVPSEKLSDLQAAFEDFAAGVEHGLALDFDDIDSFQQKVIFLSVKTVSDSFEKLKAMNARLHEIFLPQFEPGANRNYLPENFFPHVALAVKLTKEQFERGMNWAHLKFPLSAKIIAVSLAKCNPYEELARHSLTDTLSPMQRHNNMAHIRSTGGSLETSLRSQLFKFGFRFRKNDKRLVGKPDIVFPHYKAVIFVNGCFWHAHGWEPSRSPIISSHAHDAKAAYEHGWKSEESLIQSALLDESVLYSLKCEKFRMPTTNPEFWHAKFTRNRARDLRDIETLLAEGWRVGVVWECSITGRLRREKIRSTAEKISLWLEEEYSVLFREF